MSLDSCFSIYITDACLFGISHVINGHTLVYIVYMSEPSLAVHLDHLHTHEFAFMDSRKLLSTYEWFLSRFYESNHTAMCDSRYRRYLVW